MATDDRQILVAGTSPAPASFTVPGNGQIRPKCVRAVYNGAAAAAFLPVLQIVSDANVIVGECVGTQVAAGGSAAVSWFPRVKKPCPPVPVFPNTGYSAAVIQDGPRAYYKLDETSGIVFKDSSGNGFDTSIHAPGNNQLGAQGLILTSSDRATIVGSGSSSTIQQVAVVNYQSQTGSIEAWINTLAGATNNIIVWQGSAPPVASQRCQFRLVSGVLNAVWIDSGGGTHTAVGSGAINDGRTHYVVVTYDGTTITLYVDGAVNGTPLVGAFTGKTGNWDTSMGWPFNALSASNLGGYLDEVAVYDFALTATQVANHYAKATTLS